MRWPAQTSPGARSAIDNRCSGRVGRRPQVGLGAGRSTRGMRRLSLALALALLALLAPAAAHAAPEPGINLSVPFSGADLQNVKDSGAKTARFFMFYDTNTPQEFDGPVAQLKSIGVTPIFVVAGSTGTAPNVSQYTTFIHTAAAHFKG